MDWTRADNIDQWMSLEMASSEIVKLRCVTYAVPFWIYVRGFKSDKCKHNYRAVPVVRVPLNSAHLRNKKNKYRKAYQRNENGKYRKYL